MTRRLAAREAQIGGGIAACGDLLQAVADRVVGIGVIFAGAIVGVGETIEVVVGVDDGAGEWHGQAAVDAWWMLSAGPKPIPQIRVHDDLCHKPQPNSQD